MARTDVIEGNTTLKKDKNKQDEPDLPKFACVRKPAPDFKAKAWWKNKFVDLSLSQFKGKYVVLFFYPLDFTFVCPTEIAQFSDKNQEFEDIQTQVISCSIDSHFAHKEWTKKDRKKGGLGPMSIPMLSDITTSIAASYRCLITSPADENCGVAMRATYIIDDKGVLRHMQIQDLPVGRSADEVIRLVKAFKYADEYGEVCPASWNPGDATMVPNQDNEKTEKYWQQEHDKK